MDAGTTTVRLGPGGTTTVRLEPGGTTTVRLEMGRHIFFSAAFPVHSVTPAATRDSERRRCDFVKRVQNARTTTMCVNGRPQFVWRPPGTGEL